MKFIILVIFIQNVLSTHLEIQEILIKLSEKLVDFNQDEESDIFTQLDKKVSFDDMKIKSKHQCFSDYNQLGNFLEINDPQLQFLSLIAGCIIDNSMIEIKSGFTQIPKINDIVFGAYINQSENDILILVFRTFYHKSLLIHQCRLDGFSNQCIKGNNDHVQKLGSTCTTFYKDVFCNDETIQDTNELVWVFIKEYKMIGLIWLMQFFNKINKLKKDSKVRISIIVFILLFIPSSSWEFLAAIAIFIFYQQNKNFREAEVFIIFSTIFQIFLNNYIQLDSFQVEQQLAEVFILVYVLLFFLQLGMAIFSKRIHLFCILYLMSYYIEYIKALIKLNTLVDNSFKYGMVFLNIIIGNIQQLNAINLVKLKNSILHVLLGEELPFFTVFYPLILVFILLQKGHQQLQLNQPQTKKNIFYPLKCFAQIQLSFLYLPLTVLKTIFHKTEDINFQSINVMNFYLFWIYFFYFPSDFPFIALGVGFIQLFFNENNMLYKIYQEIKQTVSELKVENIKMTIIVNDFKLLMKI